MRIARLAAVLGLMILPQGAMALSCLIPDAVHAYETARKAKEDHVVLLGQFDQAPVRQGKTGPVLNFTGKQLGTSGFGTAFTGQITLVRHCLTAEPACDASYVPWGEQLIFVQKKDDRLVLFESLCGDMLIAQPSKDDLHRLLTCHRGGECLALN
jgi:hypothetical protein